MLHFHKKIPGLFKYFLSTKMRFSRSIFEDIFLCLRTLQWRFSENSHISIQKLTSNMPILSDSRSFPGVSAIFPIFKGFQAPLKTSFQFQDFSRTSRSSIRRSEPWSTSSWGILMTPRQNKRVEIHYGEHRTDHFGWLIWHKRIEDEANGKQ